MAEVARSYHPPRRYLMGPGPSDVHPRVLAAMAQPTSGHLDPSFSQMMEELKGLLRYAFMTKNDLTIPVSGPGSVGMESCFVNLVEPGDKVIVCQNGAFGGRMKENVERTQRGGIPVKVDEWGADAVYSGTQKCLSCMPGLSPLTFNGKASQVVKSRNRKIQSWFMDLGLVMSYWQGAGARVYHHTAPINPLYSLHEALVMLQEEGLENSWARHRKAHDGLKAGLEAMGLKFHVAEKDRLPQLNLVVVPEGCDEAKVRGRLLTEYDIEIGAGLGPLAGKVWRVGLLGQSASATHVTLLMAALDHCLAGTPGIKTGVAVAAAQSKLF